MSPTSQPRPQGATLIVTRSGVPVSVHRSTRARRLTLRVDPITGDARLSVPTSAPAATVRDFLDRHTGWIADRQASQQQRIAFAPDAIVPIEGVPHRIDFRNGRGHPVTEDGLRLLVTGPDRGSVSRRVTDYLKARARTRITVIAEQKVRHLPASARPLIGITLKDTKSRWGSCSSAGRLNFSWRLIMAPTSVIDYVVAHEVAHLAEMNHGPRFWHLCKALTAGDMDASKTWLKREGPNLHRYG